MRQLKILGIALLLSGCALAQNNDKFVVSGDAAKKAKSHNEISADTAEKITQACVNFAKEKNLAVSVFVLSPTGQIVHAHRMDGQVPINIETALLKAKSVLYTRDSTHARANMVANNLALQLRWSTIGVFPTAGGLPIMVGDEMIGAIGVGGSNQDEECAYTALTSVIGPQPPLAEKAATRAATVGPKSMAKEFSRRSL